MGVSAAITLLTYGLLIESWRRVLGLLGGHLAFGDGALIWLGSNLARYIPGAGWQMGVMGVMAKRRQVPLGVSTAASLLTTIASSATGIAIVLVGLGELAIRPDHGPALSDRALVILALAAAGLGAGFVILPHAGRIATRLTGRTIIVPRFSLLAIIIAVVGTAIAWLLYGIAFWLLALAVLPPASQPSIVGCITLYTFAYLVGWFNPMPAGIGVAEPAMVLFGPELGVGPAAEMIVLALFARAVRTVLEMGPSLVAASVLGFVGRDGEREIKQGE